jgi:hypothetical protein
LQVRVLSPLQAPASVMWLPADDADLLCIMLVETRRDAKIRNA